MSHQRYIERFFMHRVFAMIAAVVPLFVAAPLSAHHAADDIATDDIFDMITQNLVDANSPHLDADLDLTTDPDDGTITEAVMTVTVPAGQVTMVLDSVSDVLDALGGDGEQTWSSLDIQIEDDTSGWVTITITETIGGGEVPQGPADPQSRV
jgi:hypothetical protein